MDYVSNGEVVFGMYPPTPVYDLLKNEFSQVQGATRMYLEKEVFVQRDADVFREGGLLKVDKDFFNLFNFDITKGESNAIFDSPKAIFISNNIANKYFKGESPIGKTLQLSAREEYSIEGVIHVPSNSSIQFDFITATSPADSITWKFGVVAPIYFETKTRVDAENTLQRMQSIIDQQYDQGSYKLELVPLADQYFYSNLNYGLHGDRKYVLVFIALSVVILLLSIVNYINLATAQSIKRSKEIGIRKVIGAQKRQLIKQYFIESAFLIAVSMGLAMLLISSSMNLFQALVGKEISVTAFNAFIMVAFFVFFFVALTILSGFYPALLVAKLQPVNALKNHVNVHSGVWLRKIMVNLLFRHCSLL
jgi:putative ABC transport system permease protein